MSQGRDTGGSLFIFTLFVSVFLKFVTVNKYLFCKGGLLNCSWRLCQLNKTHENHSWFTIGIMLKNVHTSYGDSFMKIHKRNFLSRLNHLNTWSLFEQLVCFYHMDIGHLGNWWFLCLLWPLGISEWNWRLETGDRVTWLIYYAYPILLSPPLFSLHTHSFLHFSFNWLHCMYPYSHLWSFLGDKVEIWVNNDQWFLFLQEPGKENSFNNE